jgi:hypothetical protein
LVFQPQEPIFKCGGQNYPTLWLILTTPFFHGGLVNKG